MIACAESTPPIPSAPPPPATAEAPPAPLPSIDPRAAPTPPAQQTKQTFPASTPGNELTLRMLQALRGEKGNHFLSGASLRGALGMATLGARGTTLDELAKSLSVDPDPAKNAAAAKREALAWKSGAGKAELAIANRLWVEKAFPLDKAFLTQASDGYGASAENVDFSRSPDPSRQKINKWVSDSTKGKIPELLPAGSVDPLTRLVLTNAIYFKGSWVEAFKKDDTKDEAFQAPAGSVNVPTMHRTGTMSYAVNDEVALVQLPYKDSDLALLVALPRKAEQLAEIESEVSGGEVDAWAKSLAPVKVALSFPKFTFSWGRSVKKELSDLGIKAAFSNGADFTGLSAKAGKELMIADVFHKTFVLVDEAGTEAAAATGGVMSVMSAMPQQTIMKIDHPFLFFIRNTKTGELLFAGRVVNPRS